MRILRIWLGLLLSCAVASATTVVPMSIERLARASENVVEARALEQWSAWDAAHTVILTYTRFQVTSVLKGSTPQVIVVKQIGGRVGDQVARAAGVRYFHKNEETVLFLHPAMAGDSTYVITGLMQGNFHVAHTAESTTVSNGVPGVRKYDAATHAVSGFQGERLSLQELESRVRKAATQ